MTRTRPLQQTSHPLKTLALAPCLVIRALPYSEDDLAAEYARNKAIGLATGCWKGGILVENDHGHAMEAIRKRDEEEAAQGIKPPGKRMKKE